MVEDLFDKKEIGWKTIDENRKNEIFNFCDNYMNFLGKAKIEREFVNEARKAAEAHGFRDLINFEKINPGDKVYFVNRDKSMYLAVIGKEKLENGINIIGAHIDSPRLDLKPNPLSEEGGLAYLKTHYYGGIKKYQWTTIPLSIHGVIIKRDGEKIDINK